MSYKLFALFNKGLGAVQSHLRSGSYERAFCEVIKLTKPMMDNDEWYGGTDVPEEAAKIVKKLGALWSIILGSPLDHRDLSMLTAWLEVARRKWEGDASDHLGVELAFAFQAKSFSTPMKGVRGIAQDVAAAAAVELDSGAKTKKRRAASPRSPPGQPVKKARAAPASADTESWLHRLDGDLAKRQASAVQLRCQEVGGSGGRLRRASVVSGSYPLRAVGFALAEAFGKAVDDFDPHPCKGKAPPGLSFMLQRDGRQQPLKPTLKIVQAVQEPGDSMTVQMDGLVLDVTLDAMKLKGDPGFDHIKNRPMPRCVGGDKGLTPQLIKRLNRTYFCNRKPIDFLCRSKQEKVAATIEHMAKPIALRQGEPLVEGYGGGLGFSDAPGAVPSSLVQPFVF